ncbi:MAG: glycosyltransferase family 2 protein [Candidatus Dojkabacteria bacterium]
MESKLSFVIPVYNEEKTLEELVNKVLAVRLPYNYSKELILVNDGSKDNSWQIMLKLSANYKEIKSIQNDKNLGKTQTVRNGILKSTGDFVVIQDADLEYDPNEISEILKLALDKQLDAVYGNRFGKKNKVIYWQNYFGNKLLTAFSNLFTFFRFWVWIPDMEVCYKLVNGDVFREIAKDITATSNFGFEPEVTAKLSKYKLNGKRLKLGIVPISYFPRSIAEGKKMNAIRDGFKAMIEIIKYNLS